VTHPLDEKGVLLAGTLNPKTRKRFVGLLVFWEKFLQDTRPEGKDDFFLEGVSQVNMVEVIGNFIMWLKNLSTVELDNLGIREKSLSPSKLKEIVLATRRRFYDSCKNYSPFEDQRLTALQGEIRKEIQGGPGTALKRRDERRLGQKIMFGRDMLTRAREMLWDNQEASLVDNMAYIGMAWGWHVGNRTGEVSDTGPPVEDDLGNVSTDHNYNNRDFTFHNPTTGVMLKPWEIDNANKDTVDYVKVNKDTSKPDEEGKALYSNSCSREGHTRELFEDMVSWCIRSGQIKDDLFFSRRAWTGQEVTMKKLTSRLYNEAIKRVAVSFGFNSRNFSGTSIRMASSNTLELFGISLSQATRINRRANPHATSADHYCDIEAVSGALSFPADDVRHINSDRLKREYPFSWEKEKEVQVEFANPIVRKRSRKVANATVKSKTQRTSKMISGGWIPAYPNSRSGRGLRFPEK